MGFKGRKNDFLTQYLGKKLKHEALGRRANAMNTNYKPKYTKPKVPQTCITNNNLKRCIAYCVGILTYAYQK